MKYALRLAVASLPLSAIAQAVEPGMMEFQLQSVVEHSCQMEGARFLGFSTILVSASNTTVLHYGRNDQPIAESGLLLVDAGAAVAQYYDDIHMTARNILDEAGYGKYFIHGVGHFVGLDVHDVGNRRLPLKEGGVITVEPGIYIPGEGIGIRIEDVVPVTRDGPVVLSRRIPRTVEEVEATMAR